MDAAETLELARKIRAVVFDVDGVFTNNQVLEGASFKGKWRSYYDGQGVSLLRAVGIHVALVTNENGKGALPIQGVVKKWNQLPSSKSPSNPRGWQPVALFVGYGGTDKVEAVSPWLSLIGCSWEECAAMGDDLVDLPVLKKAGFRAAPAQAEEVVKKICHFISVRPGGAGAVRDLANYILQAREIDPSSLSPQ